MKRELVQKYYFYLCVIALLICVAYKLVGPENAVKNSLNPFATAFYIIGEASSGDTELYLAFKEAAEYAFGDFYYDDNLQEAGEIEYTNR